MKSSILIKSSIFFGFLLILIFFTIEQLVDSFLIGGFWRVLHDFSPKEISNTDRRIEREPSPRSQIKDWNNLKEQI